jgi:hypothetical protein
VVWLFLIVLAIAGWLMMTRRLSATLTLPLTAIAVALIALSPVAREQGTLAAVSALISTVLEPGIGRLAGAIFAVLLGAILAAQMQTSGAAERAVRYAAEYAGENHFRIGLLLLVITALLFTSLGGLGAVILVAGITLPLMFSIGFEPRIAGALFLLSLSLGGALNPVNWQLFVDVFKEGYRLEAAQSQPLIVPYALTVAGLFFVIACAFLWQHTVDRSNWVREAVPIALTLGTAALIAVTALRLPVIWMLIKHALAATMLVVLALLVLLALLRILLQLTGQRLLPGSDNWLASAAVLVPLLLILWSSLHSNIVGAENALVQVPIISALLCGIIYSSLASFSRDSGNANRLMRSLFDGVAQVGPAVVLLIGIGLLLVATSLEPVRASFSPLWSRLPLGSMAGFVLTFFLLSPLALYRGPLNLYGMGSGLMGIISGGALMPAPLVLVAFFSVGMLQGVCDPTNTHNVWIANYCKVPVTELTKVTAPWVLAIVLLALVAGSLMFSGYFSPTT